MLLLKIIYVTTNSNILYISFAKPEWVGFSFQRINITFKNSLIEHFSCDLVICPILLDQHRKDFQILALQSYDKSYRNIMCSSNYNGFAASNRLISIFYIATATVFFQHIFKRRLLVIMNEIETSLMETI